MDIEKKVIQFINTHTAPLDRLAVAVSGGLDSMCLLAILLKNFPKDRLLALSVNHNLREQALSDFEFVKAFAKKSGIDFFGTSIDVLALSKTRKISIETAAREARYEFFLSIVKEKRTDKIILAHQKNDKVEGILMNIFRGSGVLGLKGMPKVKDGYILRPMLDITRMQIQQYVDMHNIPFVEDKTNQDNYFARNFIRNEVLPLIKTKYNGVEDAIIKLSENSLDTKENSEALIVIEALKSCGISEYSKANVEDIIALKDKENGKKICLHGDFLAIKNNRKIIIKKNQGEKVAEIGLVQALKNVKYKM